MTDGLRALQVGALTLDDIDWKRDRLDVRGREAGQVYVATSSPEGEYFVL